MKTVFPTLYAALIACTALAHGAGMPAAIVLPATPTETEQFAAQALQSYLARISGEVLEIQTEDAATASASLFVGATQAARHAGLLPEARSTEDDQYRIVAQGDHLYLCGARPRGTLYAAYHLLERLGCRWFAPGYRFYKGLHEFVPAGKGWQLEGALDIHETPAFRFRTEFCEHYFLHEPDDVVALIDWAAKNRINTLAVRLNEFSEVWYRILYPEIARRDLMLTAEGHAFERFLSRSVYFQDHPEWFGPINGQNSDHYFDQFRLTHPKAMATLEANVRDFVRKFPGLHSISAMPNDSPRWSEEDLKQHSPAELLEMSYAAITRAVYETNPEMKVAIGTGVEYFGQDGTYIWDAPFPNIIWHTAVLRRTLKYAWNDPASPQNHAQYLKAAAATKTLAERGQDVVWSSRYAPFRDISLPGALHAQAMATELRDLKAIGGAGINLNYAVVDSWIPYELKHYLFARLAWNPDQEPGEIIADYISTRFSGAPEQMERFHKHLHQAMERYAYPGGGYSREEAFGRYPEDAFALGFADLDAARQALNEAMDSTADNGQKQIMWLLGASLQYARAKMEIDQRDQAGNREEAAARVVALLDWLESWTMKGVVYDSSFLRMGLERRFLGRPRDVPIKGVPADNLRVYEYLDYTGGGDGAQPQPEDPSRRNQPAPARP